MKEFKKILILLVSLVLMILSVSPLSAESKVQKDESVYIMMDSDGAVKDITVSEWLHSDSGFNNYVDSTNLTNLIPLNNDDAINVKEGKIIFNTNEKDIYYQGNSTKELPFTLNIKYYLDNKEVKAEDLLGKTGHLKMIVSLTSNLKNNQILPVILMSDFNTEEFTNLVCTNGDLINDGKNQLVMMATVLGLNEIVDDVDLVDFKELAQNKFIIECDGKDMRVPSILGASGMKGDISLEDLNIDTVSFKADINKLKDATNKIEDGTTKLKEANETLNNKMIEFKNSVGEFNNATILLKDNTLKLKDGMTTLEGGINTIVDSLNTINKIMSVLSEEEKQTLIRIINVTLEEMKTLPDTLIQMQEVLKAEGEKLNNIDNVLMSNVSDEKLMGAYGQYADLVTGTISQSINSAIDGAQIDPTSFINQENYSKLVMTLVNNGMSEDEAKALVGSILNVESVNALKDGLKNQITANVTSEETKGLIKTGGVEVSKAILNEVAQGLKLVMQQDLENMQQMLQQATELVGKLNGSVQNINQLIGKVDIQTLVKVVEGMTANADKLGALNSGAKQLKGGLDALYDGTVKINEASGKILDATNEFSKATNTLKDKTAELNDGVIKFSNEGIKVLDEKLNEVLDSFTTIEDKINSITKDENIYNNYGEISENTNGVVKFVFRTEELVKEIKTNVVKEDAKEEKLGFFERIKNLFE